MSDAKPDTPATGGRWSRDAATGALTRIPDDTETTPDLDAPLADADAPAAEPEKE